jgi:hypothetical protein
MLDYAIEAVDRKVLVDTIHDDLPPLIEELKRALPPVPR